MRELYNKKIMLINITPFYIIGSSTGEPSRIEKIKPLKQKTKPKSNNKKNSRKKKTNKMNKK